MMKYSYISEKFDQEIMRLAGYGEPLKYNDIFLRAAADNFIYRNLPEDVQQSINNMGKHQRMALPPALFHALGNEMVRSQTLYFLDKIKDCSTIEEAQEILGQQPSPNGSENFDRILEGLIKVTK